MTCSLVTICGVPIGVVDGHIEEPAKLEGINLFYKGIMYVRVSLLWRYFDVVKDID